MAEITLAVAVLAGLASFVAPCILPMIPAFLAYISGTTLSELNQKNIDFIEEISRLNNQLKELNLEGKELEKKIEENIMHFLGNE